MSDRQLPGRLADHDDERDPSRPARADHARRDRRSPTGPACAARTRCAIWADCSAGLGSRRWPAISATASSTARIWSRISSRCTPPIPTGRRSTTSIPRSIPRLPAFSNSRNGGAARCCSTPQEMQAIADQLFVGNKLASGELHTSDGIAGRPAQHQIADHRVLLLGRRHHAAAAGAGLDPRPLRPTRTRSSPPARRSSIACIRASAISASSSPARCATKEHGEFAQCMDMIDLLPPGLYEAVITGVDENTVNPELIAGRVSVRD